MRKAWFSELYFCIALVLAALVGGWMTGGLSFWLLAALTALLARHGWQLYRLQRWLGSGRQRNPPESWGIWGQVFDDYFRLQKRYYKRKKRLGKVIREFRESTAAMPDGSLVLDEDCRMLWFNDAAARDLGLKSKRDLGQPLVNLVRSPRLAEYLRTGDFDSPVIVRSPVDETRSLSVRLIPYGSKQYLALFRDVTRLLRLQAMRRDFVANASHELRSPLTVLAGYLEGLGEATPGEVAAEWQQPITEMQRQCHRMQTLVEDLLELSRLETEQGEHAGEAQAIAVPGMIQQIIDDAALQDGARHQLEIMRLEPLHVLGMEHELHSAFSNLVLNAIRYTPADGKIQVLWYRNEQAEGVFEVHDQGIGIDAKHLPFITQRFYRVDSARSRSKGGTGLGLAIVKHVLQRHDARLDVSSELGKGSAFKCIFPPGRLVEKTSPSERQLAS